MALAKMGQGTRRTRRFVSEQTPYVAGCRFAR
jgi:hypothetical protein